MCQAYCHNIDRADNKVSGFYEIWLIKFAQRSKLYSMEPLNQDTIDTTLKYY